MPCGTLRVWKGDRKEERVKEEGEDVHERQDLKRSSSNRIQR